MRQHKGNVSGTEVFLPAADLMAPAEAVLGIRHSHKNPLRSSGQPCSGQSVYCRCQTVLSCPVRRCFIFKPVVA